MSGFNKMDGLYWNLGSVKEDGQTQILLFEDDKPHHVATAKMEGELVVSVERADYLKGSLESKNLTALTLDEIHALHGYCKEHKLATDDVPSFLFSEGSLAVAPKIEANLEQNLS